MSDVKHTPGPWTLELQEYGEWIIRTPTDNALMGQADYYPWQSGNLADAYLIAAAPELLEALLALRAACKGMVPECAEQVDTAIAKATQP